MKTESYLPKKYVIETVTKYTEDTKLFRVRCNLNPKPGEFFEVTVPGIGEVPLASCSNEKKYVDILLRNAGNVTSKLFTYKKGDTIWIRGPYGKGFPLEELKGKNLIMIGGGTGIAPITSMLSYIEQHQKEFGNIWVYLGFRDETYVLLEEHIKRWKKIFHVHVGLSRDPPYPHEHKYEKGFINDIIEKHKPDTKHVKVLLCGPEGMMNSVTEELHKLHIYNHNVYWSMERRMECAFGSCGRCLIQDLYCCKDGPVFRYDTIKTRLENEESAQQKT